MHRTRFISYPSTSSLFDEGEFEEEPEMEQLTLDFIKPINVLALLQDRDNIIIEECLENTIYSISHRHYNFNCVLTITREYGWNNISYQHEKLQYILENQKWEHHDNLYTNLALHLIKEKTND